MNRLSVALAALVASTVYAASTAFWVLRTQEDFLKGKCKGVAIASEGRLMPGIMTGKVELKADAVWSLHDRGAGNFLVGTGNKGVIFLYDGKDVKEVARTDTLAVTAFAHDNNGLLLAASIPDGRLFRLLPQEAGAYKTEQFARLPASYIWALVYNAREGAFFAATGPEGDVFRIATDGAVTLWLDTKETHILSLACDADGNLFAGSAPRGLVYRIAGKGKVQVLYDCAEEEVWRLAMAADDLVACANRAQEGEQKKPPEQGKDAPAAESGPLPTHAPTAFSVYRVRKDGGAVRVFGQDKAFAWDVAVDGAGRILVATGEAGRIFRIEPDGGAYETLLELDSKAAAAIALAAGEPRLFAGNNPAALYRVEGAQTTGEYVSVVFDAGFSASWGIAGLRGSGKVFLHARSGQTAEVDDTWSDWSAAVGLEGGALLCPRGRYLQLKVTLDGAGSALDELRIPFIVDNQRPEIASIKSKRLPPKGEDAADGQEQPKESFTIEPTTPKPRSELLAIEWQAKDPDADPLVYRLYFRYPAALSWMPLFPEEQPTTEPKFTWDTRGLPEGRYALKLVASDEQNNPPGKSLAAVKILEPVVVDNRPPEVRNLRIQDNRLTAAATDATSRIVRMFLQVDAKPPRLVFPEDGIFDEHEETLSLDLGALAAPGEHIITVLADDAEGNRGSASAVALVTP